MECSKRRGGSWNVLAHPDGTLVDQDSGREYGYLFWEADRQTPFPLQEERGFCIPGREAEDCISFWLPALEANPYNIIQFLEEEYTSFRNTAGQSAARLSHSNFYGLSRLSSPPFGRKSSPSPIRKARGMYRRGVGWMQYGRASRKK